MWLPRPPWRRGSTGASETDLQRSPHLRCTAPPSLPFVLPLLMVVPSSFADFLVVLQLVPDPTAHLASAVQFPCLFCTCTWLTRHFIFDCIGWCRVRGCCSFGIGRPTSWLSISGSLLRFLLDALHACSIHLFTQLP